MNISKNVHSDLKGITAFIASEQLASIEHVKEAHIKSLSLQSNPVSYLIDNSYMDELEFVLVASNAFGMHLLDISCLQLDNIPHEFINESLIRKHQVLPILQRENIVVLATSNPLNLEAIKEFRFSLSLEVEVVLAKDKALRKMITRVTKNKASQELQSFDNQDFEDLNLDIVNEEVEVEEDTNLDDAPIVKFVNKIILDAIHKNASDIHFEPYEHSYRVRFRLDGLLEESATAPTALAPRITSRLKIMSRLDIAERRIPQDGRFKMQISKQHAIDFRVSSCPTLFGEKVVLRILDPTSAQIGIDKLGYDLGQKELYHDALSQSQGMILVTGPTGSGKTISLYTGLNILNTFDKNISTVEDPVEINFPGINQVNIHIKAGLNFSNALRSFLRQDPDIIMVGEIRDLETAEIAVRASQTGHLVLSTLHTNSAPETIARLINMGVATYNIASSIILIIAQRLIRCLCKYCKIVDNVPEKNLLEIGFTAEQLEQNSTIYKAKGCPKCNKGYKGRMGIFEVLPISNAMRRIIMENGNAIDIADQAAKENINNLNKSALVKVMDGVTSLEEINRVT